uniref:Isochorismatase domain-containing protein n=1 Tax=Ascaris lumbricoides TaxID=6252 RepID=A0A0M3HFL4_ASCLU
MIILDACKNTEGFVECPQKEFMGPHVIQLMARALSEQGILLINLLTTGDGAVSPDTVEKAFEESLKWCAHFDVPGVTNKVLACVKRHDWYEYMQSDVFHEDMQQYFTAIA